MRGRAADLGAAMVEKDLESPENSRDQLVGGLEHDFHFPNIGEPSFHSHSIIVINSGLEHFLFSQILGMSSSQLTNIFQRG